MPFQTWCKFVYPTLPKSLGMLLVYPKRIAVWVDPKVALTNIYNIFQPAFGKNVLRYYILSPDAVTSNSSLVTLLCKVWYVHASLSLSLCSTSAMSLLYECINTVIAGKFSHSLFIGYFLVLISWQYGFFTLFNTSDHVFCTLFFTPDHVFWKRNNSRSEIIVTPFCMYTWHCICNAVCWFDFIYRKSIIVYLSLLNIYLVLL